MTRLLPALWLGLYLVAQGLRCAAAEIELEDGSSLNATETAFHRMLPHAFHDQALESLPHLFPDHVLLARRRSGRLGEVVYSLVCFKESPSSARVVIQAVAARGTRAWRLQALAPPRYGHRLLLVLEAIARLPPGRWDRAGSGAEQR